MLVEGSFQGINGSTGSAEKKFSTSFSKFNAIQKGFSVNKNLHYLNITKVKNYQRLKRQISKYKISKFQNIKMSLDGSNPIIIVLNCEVLFLKPRKVHFV